MGSDQAVAADEALRVDNAGRQRILLISSGKRFDMTMALAMIEAARGRFDKLIANRSYDSDGFR